jgi:ABC-type branched-subunit amino acid transport system substrate-binding protein
MRKRVGVSCLLVTLFVITFPVVSVLWAAGPPPKEIKVGATVAMTGVFSKEWGPVAVKYMRVLESITNEQGGVFVQEYNKRIPINLIIYDDGSSPDRSVELYEKLATVDKVDFFLGPATSPILIKTSTVAEKYGIPMVGIEGNSPYIFARGFNWLVGTDTPAPEWAEGYYQLLKYLMNKKAIPALKTVAVVAEDHPHHRDVAWGGENYSGVAGMKVVLKEMVPPDSTDFSAIIIKLKNMKPDVVYAPMFVGTVTNFIKQAYEMDYKPFDVHATHSGLADPNWYQKLGAKIAEGITGMSTVAPFKKGNIKMWERSLKMTGIGPFDFGSAGARFLAWEVLTKGIESAGTLDRTKVMEAIKKLDYESLHGRMAFRFNAQIGGMKTNGMGIKPVYISQWQKGELKILWPLDMVNGEFKQR